MQDVISWNVLWCYYRWLITSIALEKYKKESDIVLIILIQGCFYWKLQLLNFLMDSILISDWRGMARIYVKGTGVGWN